jgi:hypothetical protein
MSYTSINSSIKMRLSTHPVGEKTHLVVIFFPLLFQGGELTCQADGGLLHTSPLVVSDK